MKFRRHHNNKEYRQIKHGGLYNRFQKMLYRLKREGIIIYHRKDNNYGEI